MVGGKSFVDFWFFRVGEIGGVFHVGEGEEVEITIYV